MPGLTIRWRLTLWYGGVLAASLIAIGGVVYVTFAHNLLAEIDRALDEELAEIDKEVSLAPDSDELLHQFERNFSNHPFYEIQVSSAAGVLFASGSAKVKPFAVPLLSDEAVSRETVRRQNESRGTVRVASRIAQGPVGRLVIQAADPLDLYNRELGSLLAVLLGALPLVLGAAIAGGWLLARRALAPIDRMIGTAREITVRRLNRRLEVVNPHDELGRLAATFNDLIARLENSFDEIRRFTADAAHELRTPLAVLRCETEVALDTARTTADYRHVLEEQLEEIERMSRLADELLLLCREDVGLTALRYQAVSVDRMLEDLVDALTASAEMREVKLAIELSAATTLYGDADRLRRALFNLLDNAIKYTPPGGSVTVRARLEGEHVEVTISDTGVGIAAEHLPRLFQRFYRVDPSRNGASGGFGLGLAIAKSLIDVHEGTIAITSRPGAGTQVTVALPTSAPSAHEHLPLVHHQPLTEPLKAPATVGSRDQTASA